MRFLLVDRILEFERDVRIVGTKQVAMSEDYLTWHFPERPILPGNLIVEAGAQLVGWLESASTDFERTVLLDAVKRARFLRFVVPGERVTLSVTRQAADGDRRAWTVDASVGDERCTELECEGVCVPLATLDDPARARRAFALLCGETEASA